MKIAVAGGTGKTGRLVVERLTRDGHQPVVLARGQGVDLVQGHGLDDALRGVDVIIDVSDLKTTSAKKSIHFFRTATANLLKSAARNDVRHHIVLSIIGIDRVRSAYYLGKLAQEQEVMASPVPWTILRATQFHEFAQQILDQVPGPIALIPQMQSQPIAMREVSDRLCELAAGSPQQQIVELAGPQVESMIDMTRRLIARRGQHRPVVPLRLPGRAFRAMANGALLPQASGPRGTETYEQWLAGIGS
ncbi:SDR family oxidoreductase [Mycobacterium montefiorense]|uniref:SDR family oxidoreductase n=1 Tax=Mycobacterium montefiorense TaxID=154654 RepID=UPI0021F3BA5B|nr:NAD(P)H-binding protein [Mycobacterium montefiorense]MCV7425542.1 NAD(P)H-binding protein [Mycobacterium montefiorense]